LDFLKTKIKPKEKYENYQLSNQCHRFIQSRQKLKLANKVISNVKIMEVLNLLAELKVELVGVSSGSITTAIVGNPHIFKAKAFSFKKIIPELVD